MANGIGGDNYLGIKRINSPNWNFVDRDPTPYDTQNYQIGDFWLNTSTRIPFVLVSLQGNSTSKGALALWVTVSTNAGSLSGLEGDVGGVVSPDMSGIIDVIGDGSTITTTGNITPNTLTLSTSGAVATEYITNPATGTAVPSSGVLTFAGTGTTTVSASGSTITINSTGGGSTGGIIATQFTTSGTWTKNANTQLVEILIIGAGGGGGSGSKGSLNTAPDASMGGAGGAPSGSIYIQTPGIYWGSSAAVTVPAGGLGGIGVTTDSTVGNVGGDAGSASVGSVVSLYFSSTGGPGGLLNATASSNSIAGYMRYFDGSFLGPNGGGSFGTCPQVYTGSSGNGRPSVSVPGNSAIDVPYFIAGGGGGGGGGSFAGASNNGGNGSNIRSAYNSVLFSGGTVLVAAGGGGSSPGADGGNGNNAPTNTGYISGGSGGGGGAGVLDGSSRPGWGGNGGYPGGAGGGGAGGVNGSIYASGTGGNGADGFILIIEHLGTLTIV